MTPEEKNIIYQSLGQKINSGKVKGLEDVFALVPKTRLSLDLGLNPSVFNNSKAANGGIWRVSDIVAMADLTGAEPERILRLLMKGEKAYAKTPRKKS